ncbi:MAG: hypothetical protein M5U34_41960 [Chloroflexi bacterium]|nr:hypothetical protein [Chloroflexota bacterium]
MSDVPNPSETEKRRPRLAVRIAGLLMVLTAVLIVWYSMVVYLAYQQGQVLLQEKRVTTLTAQISTQIDLARQNINDEQYNLARTRLQWVLVRSPNNTAAQSLLTEIDVRQQAKPTAEIGKTAVPPPLPPSPCLRPTPASLATRPKNWPAFKKSFKTKAGQTPSLACLPSSSNTPNFERGDHRPPALRRLCGPGSGLSTRGSGRAGAGQPGKR